MKINPHTTTVMIVTFFIQKSMLRARMLLVSFMIALIMGAGAARAQAPVTFRVLGSVTGTADVVNTGTLIMAQYATPGGATQTVNGVPFAGGFTTYHQPGGTATGALNGTTTGNAAYDTILNAFAYDGLPGTLTLTGLTSGSNYMVELWCLDGRSGDSGRQVSLSDTLGNSTFPFTEGSEAIIEGFFTASGSTQVINLTGMTTGATNVGNLNAFQVRTAPSQPKTGLKVLVLGSSQSLLSESTSPSQEAPFPPGPVATQLSQIMANDPALTGTALTVTGSDMYQSQVYSVTSPSASATLASRTLMSWYYWPSSRTATMALLDQGWDYVVMIDDPYYGSTFPEYSYEGAQAIAKEVRRFGSVPLLVMTWSGTTTPLSQFAEMTYRAGAAAGVQVVPAGYAWNSLSTTLQGTGTRPNLPGNYVTAAAIYSQIFGRSAATSSYVPTGMAQADRDTIATAALGSVATQGTSSQFSGTYAGPTHFESPLNQNRLFTYTDFNSSTEYGIRGGWLAMMQLGRVSWLESYGAYQNFVTSGFPYDFCQTRFYYAADPASWLSYCTFDYEDNSGVQSMQAGVDRVTYDVNLPEQESCASDVLANLPYDPEEMYVPMRVFWSRVASTHPEINPQPDGHHPGSEYNQGMATMMYTLYTGRCVVGTQPPDPTSEDWKNWYCRKTGYEIAWQYATLQDRVPGLEVLPATPNTTVQPNGTTTMTVRFLYPPQGNVTVNVSSDDTTAATVSPGALTFTPQNYNLTQTVTVSGVAGAAANRPFHVQFATASTDAVFNGLGDLWPYTNVTMPNPWTDADVGSVTQPGSATVTSGTYTIQGAGTNNWGTSDAFNFCYQQVSGDAVIIARVAGVQRTSSAYSTGVVTFRDSLQSSAMNVTLNANTEGSVNQFTSKGVDLTWRPSAGATSLDNGWISRSTTPVWIKLVRSGNTFTGYYGPDGISWTQTGASQVIPMSQNALVGVGASGEDTTMATAVLDNVSVQQALPTVNVVATGSPAYKQGPVAGQYTITRSGDSMASPLTVNYTMGGTATPGTDYVALSGSAVIPAGVASVVVTLTPVNGSTADGDVTATLTLASNAAYTTGSAASASVLIMINDTPFNVWRFANFTLSQLTNLAVSGPTATPENDGMANLLKFLFNIDPARPMLGSDRTALPTVGTTTTGGTEYLTLTYRQYASASGITVNVQTSSDLKTWTTVNPPSFSQQIGTDSTTGDPIMEVGVLANGTNKQFIRLNVTMP
jgi:hypothetical protein